MALCIAGTTLEMTTPAEIEVPTNKPLKILLTKKGYAPFQTEISVSKDGEQLKADLTRVRQGYVNITVRPNIGNVYINRKAVNRKAPIERFAIPAGEPVTITVYDPVSKARDDRTLTILEDKVVTVDLFPKRKQTPKRSTSSTRK